MLFSSVFWSLLILASCGLGMQPSLGSVRLVCWRAWVHPPETAVDLESWFTQIGLIDALVQHLLIPIYLTHSCRDHLFPRILFPGSYYVLLNLYPLSFSLDPEFSQNYPLCKIINMNILLSDVSYSFDSYFITATSVNFTENVLQFILPSLSLQSPSIFL